MTDLYDAALLAYRELSGFVTEQQSAALRALRKAIDKEKKKRLNNMPVYTCYIKSHADCADYEREYEASTLEEAIQYFEGITHWSKDELKNYVWRID